MKWRKLGRVYCPEGRQDWARSHAFLPTAEVVGPKLIRVYVAFLNEVRVGRVGFVDVNAENPVEVVTVSEKPVLDVGEPGTFDDNGVTPMSIVNRGARKYLYYTGWQLGVKVRYFLFGGLAVSDDGGSHFQRVSTRPILDRRDGELYVRTAPAVISDGRTWKMWYASGNRWIASCGKQVPSYGIRYLESRDGLDWDGSGRVCIESASEDEYGFGRPFVMKEGSDYKMFYSIRTHSKGYRIGYAESQDGVTWLRKDDEAGIDVSRSGWDSAMICFANVVDYGNRRYMFYNGNNYGESGFGCAVLES